MKLKGLVLVGGRKENIWKIKEDLFNRFQSKALMSIQI